MIVNVKLVVHIVTTGLEEDMGTLKTVMTVFYNL